MELPLITIAIALYNTEDYIELSVLSALSQTYDNIEVLVVDDASTDRSCDIVCKLAESHPRGNCIRLVSHKENMHIAATRNDLLDNAKGEYLFFLDSDDSIERECINHLYNIAKVHDDDIVISSYKECLENGSKGKAVIYPSAHDSGTFALCKQWYAYANSLGSNVWGILYRTPIIRNNNVRFRSYSIGEDAIFNLELFPFVNSYSITNSIEYNYLIRNNSLMHISSKDKDWKQVLDSYERDTFVAQYILSIKSRPYIDDMLAVYAKDILRQLFPILRKRTDYDYSTTKQIVQAISRHPLTIGEIIRRHKHLKVNIVLYLFGILPYSIKCCVSDILHRLRK